MSTHLKIVKPDTEAEKATRTTLDVWEIRPDDVKKWKLPPFQRPLRITPKLLSVAAEIKANDGVMPGVITLGMFGGERYLIDGQHRREAFLLSECPFGYVDVRVAHFKTMAEMADEFSKLNSRISQMRPDDYLRALEATTPALAALRKQCAYIGYDQVRRGDKSPLLSMSAVLRCWVGSGRDAPVAGGLSAVAALEQLSDESVVQLVTFLNAAHVTWKSDPEYHRLWGNLNLTMCMWLYRRTVVTRPMGRSVHLSMPQFQKGLAALTHEESYLDWLRNRSLSDTSRSPAYRRIKEVFVRRLTEEFGSKPAFPQPEWASA